MPEIQFRGYTKKEYEDYEAEVSYEDYVDYEDSGEKSYPDFRLL